MARKILKLLGKPEDLIEKVADRSGRDKRYAINSYKTRNNLGWGNKYKLEDGLNNAIDWYKSNRSWWEWSS